MTNFSSENIFHLLIDALPDQAILILSPEGVITNWNPGAQRLFGYSAPEAIGQHFSIFYGNDLRDQPTLELETVINQGKYRTELLQKRKDGSSFLAQVSNNIIWNDKNEIIGFARVTLDITEAKKNERHLQESEERLKLLVESVKDYAIFMLDPTGIIVSWNKGAQRINGYTEQEALGKHFSILYPEQLRSIGHPEKELQIAAEFGHYEEEGIRIRKDGTKFHSSVVITALYNSQQQLKGYAKVTRDITERKLAEETLRKANENLEKNIEIRTKELQEAKEAAEHANHAKTAFLANMSHEIRTPLNAVIGFSDLICSNQYSDFDLLEARDAIHRNGKLLVSLIDDILDFAKVESGQLKIDRQPISLHDLISHVNSTFGFQAQEKGLEFSIFTEGHLPHEVITDAMRLKQILFNIVGNAIKFTEKGSVKIFIKEIKDSSKSSLLFLVKDSGPGIPAHLASKLFAPFSQGDVSITRKYGGSGLGLALSRKLSQALGGNVELMESVPGKGSTFSVLVESGLQQLSLFTEKNSLRKAQKRDENLRLDGIRILIVEDISDNRNLIKNFLQIAGAKVDWAENGLVGIEKSNNNQYDLILMDLSMPVMDGFTATTELRRGGYSKPIIALTAYAFSEDRKKTLENGFNGHLTKPINKNDLIVMIYKTINGNQDLGNHSQAE